MNETDRAIIADRARRAKEFLDADVVQEAMNGLERANYEALLNLDHDKDAERRDKVNQINAIRALRAQLQRYVAEGEIIAKQTQQVA